MAHVRILTGSERGRRVELEAKGPITVGRECCEIVLADAAVSRRHARLYLRDGRWLAADLNSSNGTFVNDRRIAGEVRLEHDDQIRCGATVLLFESAAAGRSQEQMTSSTAGTDRRAETMVGLTFGTLVPKSSARRQEQAAAAGLAAMNLSHGIKNLLQTVISGREVVECAFRLNDVERARRGWTILNQSLDQINRLILDLLKFSRDSSPELQDCGLNALLSELVEMVGPEARKKGASITLDADDRVGAVRLDARLMGEAFLNLLLNAVQAVEPGGGVIRMRTLADEANGGVEVIVEDNGCGIADTEIIFEPFHTAGKDGGTGLGLPIARKIVEQHGGSVAVRSRPGEGATFTVRLPAAARAAGEDGS